MRSHADIANAVIVTGSLNFTTSADERNAEKILVIHNTSDAEKQFADDCSLLVADSVVE